MKDEIRRAIDDLYRTVPAVRVMDRGIVANVLTRHLTPAPQKPPIEGEVGELIRNLKQTAFWCRSRLGRKRDAEAFEEAADTLQSQEERIRELENMQKSMEEKIPEKYRKWGCDAIEVMANELEEPADETG